MFSINTAYARLELETIQLVIQKMGFMETSVNGSLYWFGLALLDKDFKTYQKKKCFYNLSFSTFHRIQVAIHLARKMSSPHSNKVQ